MNNTDSSQPDIQPLRIGVVGIGSRAGLAKLATTIDDHTTLVAGMDVNSEALHRFKERNPSASTFNNFDTMLNEANLDGLFITSPDHLHEEHAIQALEQGVSVYLEKPMAITVQGCDRILEAANKSVGKLYVGHNMRHFPVMQKMKELIDAGAIGEVKAAWCRHFVSYGGDAYFKDWHSEQQYTTGLLLQKGAHDIDILHWLCGGYTRTVTAMGGLTVYDQVQDRRADNVTPQVRFDCANWPPLSQTGLSPKIDVEDISMMLMQLDNGVFASYQQCHFTPDSERNYTIIGTEGRIENDGDIPGNAVVKLWNKRSDTRAEPDVAYGIGRLAGGHGGADPMIVAEFLEHIRTGCETQTSPIAARMAVAAGCAASTSLRSGGQPQDVEPISHKA